MNTLAIIQARMSSSRLPGKVLQEIGGKPMLQHVVERAQRARSLDAVLVATTSDPSDNPIADFAAAQGLLCYRGSLHDVLDRYYQAARLYQPQNIVRITADCPLIDPLLIDQTVSLLSLAAGADFACNRLPPPFGRSFPIGLDVEVCSFAALERAWREATAAFHREHVMPYLYEGVSLTEQISISQNHSAAAGFSPRNFRIAQLHHRPDYGDLRWTVDTAEDLAALREIFAHLETKADFSWYDALEVIRQNPRITQINAAVRHKTMTEVDERNAK